MDSVKLESKIIKIGCSAGVTIPAVLLKALEIEIGDMVEIELKIKR